jgi:hypothetical protein
MGAEFSCANSDPCEHGLHFECGVVNDPSRALHAHSGGLFLQVEFNGLAVLDGAGVVQGFMVRGCGRISMSGKSRSMRCL